MKRLSRWQQREEMQKFTPFRRFASSGTTAKLDKHREIQNLSRDSETETTLNASRHVHAAAGSQSHEVLLSRLMSARTPNSDSRRLLVRHVLAPCDNGTVASSWPTCGSLSVTAIKDSRGTPSGKGHSQVMEERSPTQRSFPEKTRGDAVLRSIFAAEMTVQTKVCLCRCGYGSGHSPLSRSGSVRYSQRWMGRLEHRAGRRLQFSSP